MKGKLTIKKTWHLILDEKEADIMRSLFQNPLYEDESTREAVFREKVFNALIETPSKLVEGDDKYLDDIPF
jgi:hypothetical protein